MLKRTVNFLRGTVRLEAEGPFPERFLNLCAQNQVLFWGVEWLDQTRLRSGWGVPLPPPESRGCLIFCPGFGSATPFWWGWRCP